MDIHEQMNKLHDEQEAKVFKSGKEALESINKYFDDVTYLIGYRFANVNLKMSCRVCKNSDDDYMVRDEVWLQVYNDKKGLTCLQCFEKLLGRPLTIEDFIPFPVNKEVFFGFMMAQRTT